TEASMTVRILHNPRCSKSRTTLALLEERGIHPEIVLYLETPPDTRQLAEICRKLGLSARQLMRRGEDEYAELGLDDPALTEQQLLQAMHDHPRLIERP